MDAVGTQDRLAVRARRRAEPRGGIRLRGHLRVRRLSGEALYDGPNMVVYAGLEKIVDELQSQTGAIDDFRYVGFGTNGDATTAGMTALQAEVTGGSYARLVATQGEGDNAREYRLTGTWTNNSGSQQTVREYGILSAPSGGTLLARVSIGDSGGPGSKTVDNDESIQITWDLQLADA